jgi:sialidase-1
MRKLFILFVLVIGNFPAVYSQDVPVFKSGEDGYTSYRIPAIIKNKQGHLIAFVEGRVDDAGDYGNVDIVYKVSKDNGKSWGAIQVAVDAGSLQAGNAAPVVDLYDKNYPGGRIFLFYNTGNNHESEVRAGKGERSVWYITSTDNARTWSAPVNITSQVHKIKQPADTAAAAVNDWRTYANTPGHAMQFVSGKYKGRLYIAANHSQGPPQKSAKDYFAHGFYTDDHGKTFSLGETIPFEGGNESMAAQVSGTELYMNTRNQQGNVRSRIISYSLNGGQHWDTTFYDSNLPDPVNQGSTLSWLKKKKFILAVCNTADTKNRDNLTLRLSDDKGKSWYFTKVIAKSTNGYKGSYAAYSDLVLVNKKNLGILYEKDNYNVIVFTSVTIE